jgi:hypothetical protein
MFRDRFLISLRLICDACDSFVTRCVTAETLMGVRRDACDSFRALYMCACAHVRTFTCHTCHTCHITHNYMKYINKICDRLCDR